jgi:predicted NAD/FAD-dependent oxidoreductase
VSAVPWHAIDRLWEGAIPSRLDGIVSRARAMRPSPIVTVNLWFDRRVTHAPFVGLVDGPLHWVFDKQRIFGGPSAHLSVVASGADALAGLDKTALGDLAQAELRRALPAVRGARLVRAVVVREHRATFSLAPGEPTRPGARTPVDGFYLAGDWTDTGLPGTIEGAVSSGHAAAGCVLADFARE